MAETILLVDYENVKDAGLDQLPKHDRALLFVGKGQKPKLGFIQKELAAGGRLDLIQVAEQGRNNLDFYIACYLGKLIAEESNAEFVVYSNDQDLDYLLAHLKKRGVVCSRTGPASARMLAAPPAKLALTMQIALPPRARTPRAASPKPSAKPVAAPKPVVVKPAVRAASSAKQDEALNEAIWFLKHGKRQPKNRKALVNSLASHLQLQKKPQEVEKIIDTLIQQNVIAISKTNAVTYP